MKDTLKKLTALRTALVNEYNQRAFHVDDLTQKWDKYKEVIDYQNETNFIIELITDLDNAIERINSFNAN